MPERQYGVESTFLFPLVTFGSTNADFSTAALAFAAGDALLIRDGATGVQLANTTSIARIGTLGVFSAVVTASEMQMGKGVLVLIDQSSTKLWEDQAVLIETYGSTDGEHAFNRNSTAPEVNMTLWRGSTPSTMSGAVGAGRVLVNVVQWNGIAPNDLETGRVDANVDLWRGASPSTLDTGSRIPAQTKGIDAGVITSTAFAAGALNSTAIADGALTEGKFASGALTTGVIADSVFDKIAVEVETELTDFFTVDEFGEPLGNSSAIPLANTLSNKIGTPYAILRNRFDGSTSAKTFYTSTGGVAFTKTITDTGTYIEQAAST